MKSSPMLPLLALALMLASCASERAGLRPSALTPTQTATGAIDPLCSQFRIVQLSHADTEETKAQVIANNAVLAAVCGPTPGPSRKG